MTTRIGIDTGGTFTDVVRLDRGGLVVHKLPSTPDDPGRAVLAGIAAVRRSPDEAVDVVHGTTVGLNAVLQDRLPRTVFVTNRGFADLIEIGRQERLDLYALEPDRKVPPVPRELRVEVDYRRGPRGEAVTPLSPRTIAATVARVRKLRPQAIAIGLLHSPAAPADERRLAAALRRALPDLPITASSELWPAFGEYERFSAAILNAAIAPLVANYTGRIQRELGHGRLRLMRSSMGILAPDEAVRFPARAMFSGPAGGVLATARLAAAAKSKSVVAFDMGGTSTDVCLVQAGRLHTDTGSIAGLPLPLPTVDVHTVGCGGGSIAYRDSGGALRTGPESAGAVPGPACYGKGTEPTVTDAHVALGHIGRDTLLGGGMPIDADRSVRAIERLAKRLSLTTRRTAEGILEVADATMARAIMRVTGERGVDPASVPLVAYGGAGGLHAARLAARLRLPFAIVPPLPGAFSALGLALAGETVDRSEPMRMGLDVDNERRLRRRAVEFCREVARSLGRGAGASAVARLRLRGQGTTLPVAIGREPLAAAFATAHRRRFGFMPEAAAVECVELAVRAERPGPTWNGAALRRGRRPDSRRRHAPVGGRSIEVFSRADLPLGGVLHGPCVIEETTAATLLPAGCRLEVRSLGLWLTTPAALTRSKS